MCSREKYNDPDSSVVESPVEFYDCSPMKRRLNEAVTYAKEKITKRGVDKEIGIELIGERDCSVVITEHVTQSNQKFFLVYRNNDTTNLPITKIPKGKYKCIYVRESSGCRFFLKCKILKIMFDSCKDCQISIREPIVGTLELYKCSGVVMSIRTNVETFPIVQIEESNSIHIYQSIPEVYYLVKLSVDVVGCIVDQKTGERLKLHDMGKIIWDQTERVFVLLSETEGFVTTELDYNLNEISHTFMIDPTLRMGNPIPDESSDQFFGGYDHNLGSTPPIQNRYI